MIVLRGWLSRRARNRALLRRAADEAGKDIETWSYETLSRPAEEISFTRIVQGVAVSFTVEAYDTNAAGDLHICVDVRADLPLAPFPAPSYVFWKRRDGTVRY